MAFNILKREVGQSRDWTMYCHSAGPRQWRTEEGFGVFKPPPRSSEGPPKNRAKFNPIVKTVKKLLKLGRQHPKMFRKKDSKILKLIRFAIVLH